MMQTHFVRTAAELDVLLAKFLRRFAFIAGRNIEHFCDRLASYLRLTELPRDPHQVLPSLGIGLQRAPLTPPARALWARTGDRYLIYYGSHEGRAGSSFSLWHEFFEIMAHHRGFPTLLAEGALERLADRFAAAILMPSQAVAAEAGKLCYNQGAMVPVLAGRFGVSRAAMRKRVWELGILRPRPPGSRPQTGIGGQQRPERPSALTRLIAPCRGQG